MSSKKPANPEQSDANCPKKERARRKEFVRLYLLTGNAAESARGAGYSKRSARQIGQRLLTKDDIRKVLKREYERRREKFKLEEQALLDELVLIAFSDIRDVALWDEHSVRLIPSDLLPKGVSRTIKEIAGSKFGPKIKLYDKERAADMLGRYLGLWNDDNGSGTEKRDRTAIFERLREALQRRHERDQNGEGSGSSAGTPDSEVRD